jgi:heat shock protein HslJ
MKKQYLAPVFGAAVLIVIVVVLILVQSGAAQQPPAPGSGSTDPQTLMIPRWFLNSLSLDGQAVDIPADQQSITLQFVPDGSANGKGGCNEFGTTYTAAADGKLSFGPVMSTKMACDSLMVQENAYFNALGKVTQFKTEGGRLTLSSADGKTTLVYRMPPK